MKKAIEIEEYIHPSAIRKMRTAIRDAGGNEVFFLGTTDRVLIVTDLAVLARGDGESVPAIVRNAAISDVVIHNHPDGVLCPSKADLSVASELGNQGVGFYIVDNAVETIYPVVQPSQKVEQILLDREELSAAIVPGGPVSKALKDYEYREAQLAMMETVIQAFNEDRIAMIEAGTGTGKSLAYLIPAISWSLLNGERVVVSTNTINLQEQLIGKDLPFLQKLEGLECRAVLVKGRNNYLCLRKLASVREESRILLDRDDTSELEAITAWAKKTADGSLADLSFIPSNDAWDRVCAEADQCTRIHCPFYNRCFFYRARRAASSAHLLVANHHLLMADLAVRSRTESYDRPAVLPRFHRIIIDEAQHLEDVATEYLGFQLSKFGLLKILRRLQSAKESGRGLLPFLRAKLMRERGERDAGGGALDMIDAALIPERHSLEERIHTAMDRLSSELKSLSREEDAGDGSALRVTPKLRESAFWRGTVCPVVVELVRAIEPFSRQLQQLVKTLGGLPDEQKKFLESSSVELVAMRRRLARHLECLSFFLEEGDGYCRWFELAIGKRWERLSLCAAPVDISEGMREMIYERFGTVVMTSATLTVGGRFDYFKERLGLGGLPAEKLVCRVLPSPFDYREQAFVAAPKRIAEPDSAGYEDMLEWIAGEAVKISRGRAFVLFTSYRLLEALHAKLEPKLREMGITALKQGSDNRTALLNRFRRDKAAVLFGTDSFWEGVDVKGEALQCVILTRLPFRVPSEPVQQARMEAIEARGGDPFLQYSVPQAVIKFRQGFGRLIRHREDVGAVLILDARVHTKRYGRIFLDSLPPASLCSLDVRGTLAAMEKFFAGMKTRTAKRLQRTR